MALRLCQGQTTLMYLRKRFLLTLGILINALMTYMVYSYFSRSPYSSQGQIEVIQFKGNAKRYNFPRHASADGLSDTRVTYITTHQPGRIGNVMFVYASMFGIANRNNLVPMFPDDHYLSTIFKLSAINYTTKGMKKWLKVSENKSGMYDKRMEELMYVDADMVELNGYFQSWRYFEHIKEAILEEFEFLPHIQHKAGIFIRDVLYHLFGAKVKRGNVILVGIHIRLGDMTSAYNQHRGYTVADHNYLQNAVNYFESKYGKHTNKVVFIVCSDDPDWMYTHPLKTKYPTALSKYNPDYMDLAILSSCDHVIMTVGTYGWWGAYMAGGDAVYYADYAKHNSTIFNEIEPKDFFYPKWKSMS